MVRKIESLNETAIAAYGMGNHKKAQARLMEAVEKELERRKKEGE